MKPIILILLTLILLQDPVQGQDSYCTFGNVNAFTYVPPPTLYSDRAELGSIQTADFYREYGSSWNLPYDSQTAAKTATDIWSYLITSYEPIRIRFECADLGNTVMASTHTTFITYQGHRFPIVLAEALSGSQFNDPYSADIIITVNNHQGL